MSASDPPQRMLDKVRFQTQVNKEYKEYLYSQSAFLFIFYFFKPINIETYKAT